MHDLNFSSLHNHEELPVGGRVSWVNDRVARLRLMFYPCAMPDLPNRARWEPGPPTGQQVAAESDARSLLLTDNPLRLEFRRGDVRFEVEIAEFSRKNRRTLLRIPISSEARLYGLGGQFLGLDHSGKVIECQSVDPWGEKHLVQPDWASSYYPVPLLWNSDGYALVFHASTPLKFTLPAPGKRDRIAEIEVATGALDVSILCCDSPEQLLRELRGLDGRPYVPPRWAMEPLIGHASDHAGKCYDSRVQDHYLAQMRKFELPNGIIFDEAWAWTAPEPDGHGGMRLWFHPEILGDFKIHNFTPESAGIEQTHAVGQKYVLHITPFVGIESEHAAELLAKGYLVMRASDPTLPLVGQYHHYFLDFTNPGAVEWWKDGVRRLLALGADGFFNDFGESDDQRDALYYRGTGATCGQTYCLLNRKALYEVCQEVKGDDFYLISRAGWSGMQRYAGALIGDQPGTFEGMRWALIAMQSLAMSGQGIAAHNLGGYAGKQETTVYLRWMQLGVVSPLFAMWNSGPTGEPWTFDDETVHRYRAIAELRMRLLPYLHSWLREYGETGIPMMRPMALAAPDEPALASREEQFFIGRDMLVAPVFSYSGEGTLHLPVGEWVDFWTGDSVHGGRELPYRHPLETFPLFLRAGSLVPMESAPIHSSEAGGHPLEVHVFGLGEAVFRLFDEGAVCELSGTPGDGTLELRAAPLRRPALVWRGHGMPTPRSATFTDLVGVISHPAVERDEVGWRVRVLPTGGSLRMEW